jgi:hypothetical protein
MKIEVVEVEVVPQVPQAATITVKAQVVAVKEAAEEAIDKKNKKINLNITFHVTKETSITTRCFFGFRKAFLQKPFHLKF